jgi:hypothetical protein
MKRLTHSITIITISLLIALFSAAATYTVRTYGPGYSTTTGYFLQTTPTPPAEEDRSEVGSTDGIVVMGGVIALIVLISIIVKRTSWMPTEQG